MNRTILSLLLALNMSLLINGVDWNYIAGNDNTDALPPNWGTVNADCDASSQSPIDIVYDTSVFDSSLSAIKINIALAGFQNWTLENNGHTAQITPPSGISTMTIPGDSDTFNFLQAHFHWLSSEHAENGELHDGEIHFVHQSSTDSNKYAVLGYFIDMKSVGDATISRIAAKLGGVTTKDASTRVSLDLETLLATQTITDFYNYAGSFTTPPCTEVVNWFVADSPRLYMTYSQLLAFEQLLDADSYNLLTTSRPVQPLNSRTVSRSFNDASSTFKKSDTLLFLSLSVLFSFYQMK